MDTLELAGMIVHGIKMQWHQMRTDAAGEITAKVVEKVSGYLLHSTKVVLQLQIHEEGNVQGGVALFDDKDSKFVDDANDEQMQA